MGNSNGSKLNQTNYCKIYVPRIVSKTFTMLYYIQRKGRFILDEDTIYKDRFIREHPDRLVSIIPKSATEFYTHVREKEYDGKIRIKKFRTFLFDPGDTTSLQKYINQHFPTFPFMDFYFDLMIVQTKHEIGYYNNSGYCYFEYKRLNLKSLGS